MAGQWTLSLLSQVNLQDDPEFLIVGACFKRILSLRGRAEPLSRGITLFSACRDLIQKPFLGLRTVTWHRNPWRSLQQEANNWVDETELLWTTVAKAEVGNWLWPDWASCRAGVVLENQSALRPVPSPHRSCLDSAHCVEIRGPAVRRVCPY